MQRVVRADAGDGGVSFPLHAPDDSAFGNLDASVRQAVHGHLSSSARSGYDTAGRHYADFCETRGATPFPVTAKLLGRFMIWKARYISVASLLGVYLAGVRDAHENEGHVWRLDRSPQIRKIARYLKKLYGVRSAALYMGRWVSCGAASSPPGRRAVGMFSNMPMSQSSAVLTSWRQSSRCVPPRRAGGKNPTLWWFFPRGMTALSIRRRCSESTELGARCDCEPMDLLSSCRTASRCPRLSWSSVRKS